MAGPPWKIIMDVNKLNIQTISNYKAIIYILIHCWALMKEMMTRNEWMNEQTMNECNWLNFWISSKTFNFQCLTISWNKGISYSVIVEFVQFKSRCLYTEANCQRNTDFGVHFIVFIFSRIVFIENLSENN